MSNEPITYARGTICKFSDNSFKIKVGMSAMSVPDPISPIGES